MKIKQTLICLFLLLTASSLSHAVPIAMGSTLIAEADGFPGICNAPCYTATLDYEVWDSSDAGNPLPQAGNYTYIYTLTHTGGGTLPFPGIPLTSLSFATDVTFLASAGFIPGSDIAPVSVSIDPLDVVEWIFPGSGACPGCLDQGKKSDRLFIQSSLGPGNVDGSLTALVLDSMFSTQGPVTPPQPADEPASIVLLTLGLLILRRKRKLMS